MFRVRNSQKALQSHLTARIERLSINEAFSQFMDWYETERAKGVLPIEEDGDMLLFQWGTYDWGKGMNFEVNLTRQFVCKKWLDQPDYWQFQLTYLYTVDDTLSSLGSGNRWCHSPSKLSEFRDYVVQADCSIAAGNLSPKGMELHLDHV